LYYLLAVFTERNCNRRVTKPAVAVHFVYIYAVMFTIYSVESSKILTAKYQGFYIIFGKLYELITMPSPWSFICLCIGGDYRGCPQITCLKSYYLPLILHAHCCHMRTAIQHHVPDLIKLSFVIFDIRALWRSGLSVRVPRYQNLQMTA